MKGLLVNSTTIESLVTAVRRFNRRSWHNVGYLVVYHGHSINRAETRSC
jgi:hypothetical protein